MLRIDKSPTMADQQYTHTLQTDAALAQQLTGTDTGAPTTRRRTRGGGTTKARTTNSRTSRGGSAKSSTSRGGKTTGRGRGSALKEAKANAARLKRKRELLEEGLPVQKWCRVKRQVKNGGWNVWVWVPVSELKLGADGKMAEFVEKGTLKLQHEKINNNGDDDIHKEQNTEPVAKRSRVESDVHVIDIATLNEPVESTTCTDRSHGYSSGNTTCATVTMPMNKNDHPTSASTHVAESVAASSTKITTADTTLNVTAATDDTQQQQKQQKQGRKSPPVESSMSTSSGGDSSDQQSNTPVADGFASFASENMMDAMLRMMQQQQQDEHVGGNIADADFGGDVGF